LLPPSHNLKKGAAGSTYHLPYIPEERIYTRTFTTAITSELTILLLLLRSVCYNSIQYSLLTHVLFIHFHCRYTP